MILLGAGAVLVWLGGTILDRLRSLTSTVFLHAFTTEPPPVRLVLEAARETVVACLWPVLGVSLVTAVASGLIQVRPLLTAEPLKPRLERLDPVAGLKRVFGGRGVFQALMDTVKVALIGVVLGVTLLSEVHTLVALVHTSPLAGLDALGTVAWRLLLRGGLVLLLLAGLDVLYQRHRHLKDLRMTRQEVKQEHRETEGDQSLKGERKRLHAELLEQAMLEQVRRASVVIVNPDHLAVALGYEPDGDEAPVVLASGQNLVARRIVEIAREHGIPVLRDVVLARSLADVEVGQQIPEELYEAVAEILRLVMEHGK
jgi:flagellar biosynthetic protein FlhB